MRLPGKLATEIAGQDDQGEDEHDAERGEHRHDEADARRGHRGAAEGGGHRREPDRRAAGFAPQAAVGFHALLLIGRLAEFAADLDDDAVEETRC